MSARIGMHSLTNEKCENNLCNFACSFLNLINYWFPIQNEITLFRFFM